MGFKNGRAYGAAIVLLSSITVSPASPAESDNLWRVVHNICVPAMQIIGRPTPCAAVDLARHFAVLKVPSAAAQYLVIPTDRMSGIESPELLDRLSPNYWQFAWEVRKRMEKQLGRPISRTNIGLAINSVYARTQNQMHIHVACVRPEVRQSLQENLAEIGTDWSKEMDLVGQRFYVRWLAGQDLGANDPFKMVVEADPSAAGGMAAETLAVVGGEAANGTPGFFLLSGHANPGRGGLGAAESLLDRNCDMLAEGRQQAARVANHAGG